MTDRWNGIGDELPEGYSEPDVDLLPPMKAREFAEDYVAQLAECERRTAEWKTAVSPMLPGFMTRKQAS